LAKQAVTLAPDLAEAHIALGLFHYYGFREYEPALTEFQRSIEVQPNNALAIGFVGFVHRRQGKWDRTLDELKRSIDLNPRDPRKFFTQGSQGTRKALRLTLRSLREIHLISGRSFIQRIYHRIRILFILCCKLEIIFLQQTNRLQISRAQLPFNRF
jgi:tetratricopeptide (TPR) repeat protein